jgi:myxalamid-type polyketide synthase MxaE and MxaD
MAASTRTPQLTAKQQALLALRLQADRPRVNEPIAIIGMGCRFPGGADSPSAFWDLLRHAVDAITEVPPERWPMDAYYDPQPGTPGKMYSKWGAFLPDADRFDARFFSLSPREVINMDPQQRLLLEVAWEALDDAGHPADRLKRTPAGVFIGVSTADYARVGMTNGDLSRIDAYYGTGNSFSVAAGRIAYLLGTHGPALAVDTACSSSLVALHLACQSLRAGECDMAIVGGVNLVLVPETTIFFSGLKALAKDGRCKAFDAAADGYVRGEGVGIVVVKRLSAAIRDGDRIDAVVRGTAVNHDGPSSGLTVPNGLAQEAVIRQALRDAHLSPGQISYVEAHGTGTALGDPIEIHALSQVFQEDRAADRPLQVGSVKTNFGHLEAAAGVAGLIKVVLSLKHRQIPPHLHLREPSPRIDWHRMPIVIPQKLTEWREPSGPLLAGVSSFGFSGTNAHVILEQPPLDDTAVDEEVRQTRLVPVSAKSARALTNTARRLADRLAISSPSVRDVAFTTARRRSHHGYRLFGVGSTPQELSASLRERLSDSAASPGRPEIPAAGGDRRVVFIFPGQGSEWPGMGRELFAAEQVFRRAVERCHQTVQGIAGWSLIDYFDARHDLRWPAPVDVVHPLLFAVGYALAELWQSWGIRPHAVAGQSLGEIAAFCVAGALTPEQAMTIMCHRSRLVGRTSGQGRMAMIALPRDQALAAIAEVGEPIFIAVNRSPDSVVVAGHPASVDRLVSRLQAQGVFCRVVVDDIASHCPLIGGVLDELNQHLIGLTAGSPSVPIYSSVTGTRFDGAADAAYWCANLGQPVLWAETSSALVSDRHDVFLELSPHPALLSAVEQTAQLSNRRVLTVPSLHRDGSSLTSLLTSAGTLYAAGIDLEWQTLSPSGRCVSLPNYAWDRERFWVAGDGGTPGTAATSAFDTGAQQLTGSRLGSPLDVVQFATTFDAQSPPYLADHRVEGTVVVAGASHVALILAVSRAALNDQAIAIERLTFLRPMLVEDGRLAVQTTLDPQADGSWDCRLFSRDEGATDAEPWSLHASARLIVDDHPASAVRETSLAAEDVPSLSVREYYDALAERGYGLGPSFRWLQTVRLESGGLVATLREPETDDERDDYPLHPGLIDSCFQAIGAARFFLAAGSDSRDETLYVPAAIDRIRWYRPARGRVTCRATLHETESSRTVMGDLVITNDAGELVASIEGFEARAVAVDQFLGLSRPRLLQWLKRIDWERKDLPAATPTATGRWLVFADAGQVGEAVAASLRAAGGTVDLVRSGDGFHRTGSGAWTIVPNRREHFDRVLSEALSTDRPINGILHFWSLDARMPTSGPEVRAALERSCVTALSLTQALIARQGNQSPRLWLITRGACVTGESDRSGDFVQSAAWGLGRVIGNEQPRFRCTLLDIDETTTAASIAREVTADDRETQVALRGSIRSVARLSRFAPNDGSIDEDANITPDGTYLITGGFGGLGLTVARWLIDKGARTIVLAGRSKPTGHATDAITDLGRTDATIVPVIADVGDERHLRSALIPLLETAPPLRGVVHCAGVLEDGLLPDLDADRMQRALHAKAVGAWHLHELTSGVPLDFFVLFSSVASLVGSPGQAAHAAASACLNGLAAYRRAQGLSALSIDWCAWSEVGSAVGKRSAESAARAGMPPIRPNLGLQLLDWLIAADLPHAAVMSVDWSRWFRRFATATESPFFDRFLVESEVALADTETTSSIVSQLHSADLPRQRRALLEECIRRQIARVLRQSPDQIESDTPFGLLGFDSLMALEVKTALEKEMGIVLPVSLVWNYPTVAAVAGFVAQQMGLDIQMEESGNAVDVQRAAQVAAMPEADVMSMLAGRLAALDGDD